MLFSIITVSYNSATTIKRTIESVLNQDFLDYEYLIIDGNSSDETMSIVKSFEKTFDGRLKYISESDKGIYDAMNKGIQLAKGSVIGIVNSDDWLEPTALKTASQYFNSENVNQRYILSGWMNFHYLNGKIQILKNSEKRYMRKSKNCQMGLRHPATFVTKKTYSEIGLFDLSYRISADRDFILRCYIQNVKVLVSNDIFTNMSDGGVSNLKNIMTETSEYASQVKKYVQNPLKQKYLISLFKLKQLIKNHISLKQLMFIRSAD